ncbi:MAG: hypothetical protein F4065_02200 [Rhodothermaceae bacterium]|nr:hypothetical protein [Rhodothermaceae bacterium]MXZ18113.1 hypothetical protein [Rhodothermaceae bacterium]MXZ57422.1 hypothetical protein [Rhodothermaceae bacterium]MYB90406.1 hypothetical protein [Rhodothermaceae bacterium]MYD68287.1 hypothetical protein [Rhodothermaceae bacterium]
MFIPNLKGELLDGYPRLLFQDQRWTPATPRGVYDPTPEILPYRVHLPKEFVNDIYVGVRN